MVRTSFRCGPNRASEKESGRKAREIRRYFDVACPRILPLSSLSSPPPRVSRYISFPRLSLAELETVRGLYSC